MICISRRAAAITPILCGSLASNAAVTDRHSLGTVGLAADERQDQNKTGGRRISNYNFFLSPPDKSYSLDSLTRITDSLMLTGCLYASHSFTSQYSIVIQAPPGRSGWYSDRPHIRDHTLSSEGLRGETLS